MDDFGVVKLVPKANTPKSSKTRHLSESSNDYFNVVPETTRKSSDDHFFLLVSLSYDDLVITLERLNDKPQIVKWWSCD